uniref:Uncharacterized protein n=1 Tax=Cacopsylla melanoneura TaxID=428564 RepID=A0A8D9B369_9HEMI
MAPTATDVRVSRIFPKHSPLERSRIRGNIIGKRLGKVFLFNSTFPSFFFLRFLLTFPRKSCKLGMRSCFGQSKQAGSYLSLGKECLLGTTCKVMHSRTWL